MRAVLLSINILVALSALHAQVTDVTEPTDREFQEAVSQEILANIADAADTVCKAFNPSPEVITRSIKRRSWWSKLFEKGQGRCQRHLGQQRILGKRPSVTFALPYVSKTWTDWYRTGREAGDSGVPKCNKELAQKLTSIQDALVVLGTMTDLVTSAQGCSKKPEV
ncbi:uncharacterized protein LOC131930886 isoform X2 [Physella acuta]|uniref:uncharacterized protein LOC131930886 isoform X2 n=1 Tax=Physella acuta TaxID=109671 RepID=UPI0027DE6C65|nr:uncharacterized protein LOC131930886 isoform X2 [Physella acuta]XP_059143533.1 uncharacterized protein LOC131930886 isoform X2 [Physella acuta]